MEEKSVAQSCLDLWGEKNQIYQMIEEGSELVTALCHQRRGRFNMDRVYEEVADCLAMLDQMDLVFGKLRFGFVVPNPVRNLRTVTISIIFIAAELQSALIQYSLNGNGIKVVKGLLYSLREHLNFLATVTDKDAIAKWKDLKRKRILKRLELNAEQKNCHKS